MTPSLFKTDATGSPPPHPTDPGPNDPSEKPRRKHRADSGVISVFGPGLTVDGQVTSHGDITIEGRLEGNLKVEGQVSVAGQGVVEGDIQAERVIVAGRVKGTIAASEGAQFVSGAKVDADISSPKLQLEEGATLNGRIDMGSKRTTAESPSAKSESPAVHDSQKQGAA